ncbi:MAG: NAD(P)H-dependent oxidoreductase [Rhodocyclaceae bacterium]|nr:NAD(P)H-dependent oxidoreductase [Rhodocyclaceae bacterium]
MIGKDEILAAFRFRHACKQMDPEREIPDDEFAAILEAGRLSPSSFGYEPWHFLVIQNPVLREKLKAVAWGAQGTLPTASHFLAILVRKDMRFDQPYVDGYNRSVAKLADEARAGREARFRNFQEHDHRLLADSRYLLDWAGKQTYIALANMLTAAALMGVDSCPVEGFHREKTEALLAEEGLLERETWSLSVMAAFGYRVNPQPAKTRRPMTEVVSWVR